MKLNFLNFQRKKIQTWRVLESHARGLLLLYTPVVITDDLRVFYFQILQKMFDGITSPTEGT
jgi:hypothetical protein